MLIEQMMRNEGKNFTEYECAIMFQRFKDQYGYTQAEIAAKFGKSGAFISRCLSLMELAPEIQKKMEVGEISTKAVREIAALHKGDERAQVKAVKDAVANAKEKGKKTATGKNIGKELQEQKAVNKVKAAMNLFCKGLADANINLSKVSLQDLQEALSKSATLGDVIKNI